MSCFDAMNPLLFSMVCHPGKDSKLVEEPSMTAKQLREVHQAKPFRPFKLQIADGNEIEVRHPGLMMMTPGGRTVVVAISDDAVKIIDLMLVASIEVGNGRAKKGRKR